MKKIRVASVQFEHAPGDKEANLGKIRRFVKEASARGVELVVFPECCISGYWHLRHLPREELVSLAEPVPEGPSTQELARLAREHGMTVGAGLVESEDTEATADGRRCTPMNGGASRVTYRRPSACIGGSSKKLYNAYVVATPEGEIRRHRKLHCFISEHLGSGSEYTVFDTPQGSRVGVLTCYDCNIIENSRITALMGAEILLAPHQTGGCALKTPHAMGMVDRALWEDREKDPGAIEAELRGPKGRGWLMRWLPSRAHDNGMFLVFSNGVGPDDDEVRTGNAMIIDPFGRILAETCYAGDDMVVADLDPSLLEMNTGRRWIRTRRPELYGMLCRPTGREEDTRRVRFEA